MSHTDSASPINTIIIKIILHTYLIIKTLKEGDELWITEGVSDCLAMLSAGKKAIAIPSATLLKPKMVETMRFFVDKTPKISLHMYPDNDKAGASMFFDLQKKFQISCITLCLKELKILESVGNY